VNKCEQKSLEHRRALSFGEGAGEHCFIFFLPIESGNTIERINLDGTDSDHQILESMDSHCFLTWINQKLEATNELDSDPSRVCNLISTLPMKKRKPECQPQPFLNLKTSDEKKAVDQFDPNWLPMKSTIRSENCREE
jgi:hypothetical protein